MQNCHEQYDHESKKGLVFGVGNYRTSGGRCPDVKIPCPYAARSLPILSVLAVVSEVIRG